LPFNFHIILAWRCAEDFDTAPRAWTARQGELIGAMTSWLNRQQGATALAYNREIGGFGPHTHILVHVRPELRDALHRHLIRAGRFKLTVPDTTAICIRPSNRACMIGSKEVGGVLRYFGKHLSPTARHKGDLVMQILGIDDRGRGPCTISGKRSGMSRNIDRAARKAAGWRELRELDELRAVLDGEGVRHAS
jgi:hypothetical protein